MKGAGGTTKVAKRGCKRCSWRFITTTHRLADNGEWRPVQPNEICIACRDLLAAEQRFETAMMFYSRARTEFQRRLPNNPEALAKALQGRIFETLSRADEAKRSQT